MSLTCQSRRHTYRQSSKRLTQAGAGASQLVLELSPRATFDELHEVVSEREGKTYDHTVVNGKVIDPTTKIWQMTGHGIYVKQATTRPQELEESRIEKQKNTQTTEIDVSSETSEEPQKQETQYTRAERTSGIEGQDPAVRTEAADHTAGQTSQQELRKRKGTDRQD